MDVAGGSGSEVRLQDLQKERLGAGTYDNGGRTKFTRSGRRDF